MKIGMRLVNMSVAAAVAGALLGSLVPAIDASAAAVVQVTNNVPRLVNSATFVGHHNPKAVLDIKIALSLQNTDKLAAYMQEVHDKTSPNYHKYLTPKQFTALYCPSAAQVQAVEQFLKQRGISVTKVSPNNTRVYGSASTAVVESALGVAINDYKGADGTTFYSASSDPSLPSTISGYVKAVMGLDDAVQYQSHAVLSTTPAPKAVSAALPAGFSPQQVATAYDWYNPNNKPSPLTDATLATGVTIAIATAYTYRPADIQKFWSTYGLPAHTDLTNVAIDGVTARLEAETTLDIERSSSMSPGSNIVVFEAFNPSDQVFDDMFVAIANDVTHNIKVMSTSWGEPENISSPASLAAEHDDFVQLNSEGIVMLAAAGDGGAADREAPGTDNADFPASDPYVLAAGGTHLVLNGNDTIASESAWTDAGGADSLFFAQPYYQNALVSGWTANNNCSGDFTATFTPAPPNSTAPPTLGTDGCAAASNPSRQSSDMSMDADPDTGYSVYFNGRWAVYGGTSFVAPELAGFFAELVKSLGTSSDNAPQVVYCAASGPNYAADFHDIVTGQNSATLLGTFDAGTGWDHPTGWGTPDANLLIADINANCQL